MKKNKTAIPEKFLHQVLKPARYTGGEFGNIYKDEQNIPVKFALAFPDIYDVGMSYLGFKILYHLLNQQDYIWAERVYTPWVDMQKIMQAEQLTLGSIESKRALNEFDFVGFTLQYEMSYTNIVKMLQLGKIDLLAKERDENQPFIVGGGPCVYNCEPLADFFDIFIIGEGEEVLIELCAAYKNWKLAGRVGGKKEFLRLAAQISGIYIPNFYDITYQADGQIAAVKPNMPEAPAIVYKRVVQDLDKVDYFTKPIIPFTDIVHNRIMLEIFRGCTRGCRFCHAGMVYRPVRERSKERLKELARKLVANTGYDEMSLVSLSTADYSCLQPLIEEFIEEFRSEQVSVSLPSLRIDSFSVDLAKKVQTVRRSSLTFAPEAGSQRMRDVINKGVTKEDLLNAVKSAFESGWSHVKLYFMIGLPTETDEDIKAIAELAYSVLACYKEVTGKGGAKVTVSVSNFVPKPHTPFQWVVQTSEEELKRKQYLLKEILQQNKNINFQYHDSKVSRLEGVFARGDRRLGKVLARAVALGAEFDGWSDKFNYQAWVEAFALEGVDMAFYIDRQRDFSEVFPWDHIQPAVQKSFLISEYQKALAEQLTTDCRRGTCTGCGVCPKLGVHIVDGQVQENEN